MIAITTSIKSSLPCYACERAVIMSLANINGGDDNASVVFTTNQCCINSICHDSIINEQIKGYSWNHIAIKIRNHILIGLALIQIPKMCFSTTLIIRVCKDIHMDLLSVPIIVHVASPASDRPSVYRISASITPTRCQYVYQTTSS